MDAVAWISSVTSFAALAKAWLEARKAGLELAEARAKANEAGNRAPEVTSDLDVSNLVISQDLLDAYAQDIRSAESRFSAAINDPRYTPAQLSQEEEIARISICTHLGKISDFNGGALPAPELVRLFSSWRCEEISAE